MIGFGDRVMTVVSKRDPEKASKTVALLVKHFPYVVEEDEDNYYLLLKR